MGRPKGTKNNMRTLEEKAAIVEEYLNENTSTWKIAEKYGITQQLFRKWKTKYLKNGINGLISQTGKSRKNKTGRPKKTKTEEEKLKREIIKLEIEVARLKKGYLVKGVGAKKEFVTTFDLNTK